MMKIVFSKIKSTFKRFTTDLNNILLKRSKKCELKVQCSLLKDTTLLSVKPSVSLMNDNNEVRSLAPL